MYKDTHSILTRLPKWQLGKATVLKNRRESALCILPSLTRLLCLTVYVYLLTLYNLTSIGVSMYVIRFRTSARGDWLTYGDEYSLTYSSPEEIAVRIAILVSAGIKRNRIEVVPVSERQSKQ